MTPRRVLGLSLALFAFAAPVSIAGLNGTLALVSVAVLWALADRRTAEPTRAALRAALRSPAFLALAAYALWEPVSGFGGLEPLSSLRLWPKELHKLWAFLALWTAVAVAEDAPVASAFAAGLAFHAAVGVWQGASEWVSGFLGVHAPAGERLVMYAVRAHGFTHPVTYGELMGLGLIAAAASALPRPRALTGLLVVALLLNETRATAFALAAAWGAAALVDARWRRWALAGALGLAAAFAFWEVMPTGGRNLRTLFFDSAPTSQHRTRVVLWQVAWDAGRERPLFGVGSGQYHRAFEARHPEPLDGQPSWSNAHDLYLHQFAERGLPGLLVVLAALGALGAGAWRAAVGRRNAWALAAWAAVPAFFVMNLTETAFQTEQVATVFLFLWILGAGPDPGREIL